MNILFGNKCLYMGMFDKYFPWNGYMSAFVLDFSWSTEGDHSPKVDFIFILFNLKIIEIGWYDIRHKEIDDE